MYLGQSRNTDTLINYVDVKMALKEQKETHSPIECMCEETTFRCIPEGKIDSWIVIKDIKSKMPSLQYTKGYFGNLLRLCQSD